MCVVAVCAVSCVAWAQRDVVERAQERVASASKVASKQQWQGWSVELRSMRGVLFTRGELLVEVARIRPDGERFIGEGDVVISVPGYSVQAERVVFEPGRIEVEHARLVRPKGVVLSAERFIYELESQSATLQGVDMIKIGDGASSAKDTAEEM